MGKFILSLLCTATIGVGYYHAYISWQASSMNLPSGKEATFLGIVVDEPHSAGDFMMIKVNAQHPYAGMIDLFASPHSQFHYGELLWIKGTIDAQKNGDEIPTMFFPQTRTVAEHDGSRLEESLIAAKNFIIQKFDGMFSADQAALLAGIVIGTTSTLSATLKAQMEASGTSYIVGMYGYKIAIISLALTTGLKDRVPRKIMVFITLIAISLFVIATDGSISAIRAAIMGSFALIARGSGRVFSARNALTFAAMGMVLANATILTDAAFQLSFLSFFGIYHLGPPLKNLFHWSDKGVLHWKEHTLLSLSTNLAILPITMRTFGSFSLTSFISNVFIMIPWPLLLAGGASIIVLGSISSYAALFIVQVVKTLLRYELWIIALFSRFVIPTPAIFGSVEVIVLYYAALLIFAYYYATPSQENY